MTHKRSDHDKALTLVTVTTVIASLVLLALFLVNLQAYRASAEVTYREVTVQPYGGCKEAWQAPRSEGADDCRALGWKVYRTAVVGPRGWVRVNRLPACQEYDLPRCYFDHREHGGDQSFIWVGTWRKHQYVEVKGFARN